MLQSVPWKCLEDTSDGHQPTLGRPGNASYRKSHPSYDPQKVLEVDQVEEMGMGWGDMGNLPEAEAKTRKNLQVQVPPSTSRCLACDRAEYGVGNRQSGACWWEMRLQRLEGQFIHVLLNHVQDSAEEWPTNLDGGQFDFFILSFPTLTSVLRMEHLSSNIRWALRRWANLLPNGIFKSVFYFTQESKYAFKITSLLIMK